MGALHHVRALGPPSARHRVAFLRETPARFHGRLTAADTPGYAVVSDGRDLVVLPMTRELRDHVGRNVVLEREARGKLRVQVMTLDREA